MRSADFYDAWVAKRDEPAGSVAIEGVDEPAVDSCELVVRGVPIEMAAALYPSWVLQRGLDWLAAQDDAARTAGRELLGRCGGGDLLDIELSRPLLRVNNQIALG